jgi:hypothetical protein
MQEIKNITEDVTSKISDYSIYNGGKGRKWINLLEPLPFSLLHNNNNINLNIIMFSYDPVKCQLFIIDDNEKCYRFSGWDRLKIDTIERFNFIDYDIGDKSLQWKSWKNTVYNDLIPLADDGTGYLSQKPPYCSTPKTNQRRTTNTVKPPNVLPIIGKAPDVLNDSSFAITKKYLHSLRPESSSWGSSCSLRPGSSCSNLSMYPNKSNNVQNDSCSEKKSIEINIDLLLPTVDLSKYNIQNGDAINIICHRPQDQQNIIKAISNINTFLQPLGKQNINLNIVFSAQVFSNSRDRNNQAEIKNFVKQNLLNIKSLYAQSKIFDIIGIATPSDCAVWHISSNHEEHFNSQDSVISRI